MGSWEYVYNKKQLLGQLLYDSQWKGLHHSVLTTHVHIRCFNIGGKRCECSLLVSGGSQIFGSALGQRHGPRLEKVLNLLLNSCLRKIHNINIFLYINYIN